MSSLAGATAGDAVSTMDALLCQVGGLAAVLQTPPPNAVATALNPAPTAPTSPVSGTKISLATPDLAAIRKAAKECARKLGPTGTKAEFNVERDKAVARLSQALGFNGVTDTIAVTTKLKGVIDHSKVGKYELDKSLKSIFCRQWEEVARSNDPVKM